MQLTIRAILSTFIIVTPIVFHQKITSQAPLTPRKVLFGNPEKTMVRVSPDGTCIAYLAPKDGGLNVIRRIIYRKIY